MPDVLGTAFVEIRPLTTGFLPALERQVKPAAVAASKSAGSVRTLAAAERDAAASARVAATSQAAYTRAVAQGGVVLPAATRETARLTAATQGLTVTQQAGAASTRSLAASQGQLAASSRAATAALQGTGAGALAARAGVTPLQVGVVAAGVGTLFALKQFASFEKQLNVFQAIAKATGDEMGDVARRAKELGADITLPGTSATDAAEAMTELARAGLSVDDAIDAAKGTLQLAAAAETDTAVAAKIAGAALNAFGLSGEEAVRVADLLAGASISAQGTIEDMSFALAQASAVARQTGVSIEDTTTFIALLAKSGILGGRAGTSLRGTFLSLTAATGPAAKEIKRLNLAIADQEGNIRPLPDIFADLTRKLSGATEAQRTQTLATIFGRENIKAASIIVREGTEGFSAMKEGVTASGAAADLSLAKMEGLSGAVEGLTSNVETLALSFGEIIGPALTDFTKAVTIAVGSVNDLIAAIGKLDDIEIPFSDRTVGQAVKDFGIDVLGAVPGIVQLRAGTAVLRTSLRELREEAERATKIEEAISTGEDIRRAAAKALVGDIVTEAAAAGADVTVRPTDVDFELRLTRAAADEDRIPILQQRADFISKLITRIEKQTDLSQEERENLLRLYGERDDAEAEITSIRQVAKDETQRAADKQADIAKKRKEATAKAAREAAKQLRDNISLQQQRLSLAQQQAQLTTETTADDRFAQQQIIVFLEQQVQNARLSASERLNFQAQLVAIQQQIVDEEQRLAEGRRQAFLDQQGAAREGLNLRIQRARLTQESLKDDTEAQQSLIELLKEQVRTTRVGSSERRRLQSELISAQLSLQSIRNEILGEEERLAEERKQTLLDQAEKRKQALSDQRSAAREELNLQIQRARLTQDNLEDDAEAQQSLIDLLKKQVETARAGSSERRRLQSELISAQLSLQTILGERGRTPVNFFQEAVDQFRKFGSNLAKPGGILSEQGARGALAGFALQDVGDRAIQQAQQQRQRQLTEAERQTALLSGILNAVARGGGRAPGPGGGGRGATTENQGDIDTARFVAGAGVVN